ncbi:MAG: hypothetical protein DU429_05800 [Candidatus Tokpelaia sp.]|nr:MAG: hypothetical protein DU430_07450 [Candidatus Tokpelaia sp.]KAA6206733.1 MAG: hypothetical protein DU429_05800 [Candidatus Tokpelaia sp.]
MSACSDKFWQGYDNFVDGANKNLQMQSAPRAQRPQPAPALNIDGSGVIYNYGDDVDCLRRQVRDLENR